tara:strand:- start:442 stop:1077 length:636 start_codon:yes stop_codon:yes gene_type:complete
MDLSLLYNPYDLLIIRKNIIPQENIEELMLLTNTSDTTQATVINEKKDDSHETNLEVRDTLWYNIPDPLHQSLERAISGCFSTFVAPKYNCQFKAYEPVQLLGYAPGGHYKGHNDGESFNMETRQWDRIMNRDVSFLFYLNDQYGGGELEFYDLGLTIKPKKGMMIAFPSYKEFAHKVHPVTWGHRYALVCWVETQKNIYDTISQPRVSKD